MSDEQRLSGVGRTYRKGEGGVGRVTQQGDGLSRRRHCKDFRIQPRQVHRNRSDDTVDGVDRAKKGIRSVLSDERDRASVDEAWFREGAIRRRSDKGLLD